MNYFLSGWAVPEIKGYNNYNFLDSTKIVAEYKTIENIARNFDKIFPKNIKTLAAWSMGAIIVLGVLQKIKAEKIILLSPALKFAANDEDLSRLNMLRKNIIQNKETAVKLFFRKCAIPKEASDANYYTTEELLYGLDFLEKTEINPAQIPKNSEIIVISGENDKIISQDLSINVAEKLGAKFVSIPNGSHFFMGNRMFLSLF